MNVWGRIPWLNKNQAHTLLGSTLWSGYQDSEERRDRDDLKRLDLVKAQEVVVSADEPAYSCCCRG
jgi:hypothetical protein